MPGAPAAPSAPGSAGIPALALFQEPEPAAAGPSAPSPGGQSPARRPVVVLVHGLESRKEALLGFGLELASRGLFAVLMDAAGHGERRGSDPWVWSDQPGSPWLQRMVERTAAEVIALVDHFSDHPAASTERVGVSGVSMGAFTSLEVALRDPRVVALAPILASGRLLGERLRQLYPKALLLLNGTDDQRVPIDEARELYRRLQPLYGEVPDRLELFEYRRVGHQLTVGMQWRAAEWMHRHLVRVPVG